MRGFNRALLVKTTYKRKVWRYGLSLVYGMPVSKVLERRLIHIQKMVEGAIPRKYAWYRPQQFHVTLIRGRSSDRPLSLGITSIYQIARAFPHCQRFKLSASDTLLCPDGYVRLFFKRANILRGLDAKTVKNIGMQVGVSWRRILAPWASIGYLATVHQNKEELMKVWNNTSDCISKMQLRPTSVLVTKAKLVYFSNITFAPANRQLWTEIPLL